MACVQLFDKRVALAPLLPICPSLRLRGANFLAEHLGPYEAMCGSAMEVSADTYTIRDNDVAYNGFEEAGHQFGL
jgi:hypothetical protein